MIQSFIQQVSARAGTLLARRPHQIGIVPFRSGARKLRGRRKAELTGGIAEEQLKIFNGLLQTLSSKLLVKVRELDCVSGELRNLMKVCATPAILVDEKLVIRGFTRESRQIYRLSHEDIGRSLLNVASGLDYRSLEEDFRRVATTGRCVNRYLEVRGSDLRYFMRILPHICRDKSFGGATLVFSQIPDRQWYTA